MYLTRWMWLAALLLSVWPAIPAVAQDEEPRIDTASVRSGFQFYREGHWSEVRSIVANPTGQVQRPLISTRLEPRDHIEFARRLWLPPYSRRFAYTPVYPFVVEADSRSIEAPTRMIDDSGRTPRAWPWQPSLLPVRWERMATVHLGDPRNALPRGVVRTLRVAAGMNDMVLLTAPHNVPGHAMAWDAVDVLSISGGEGELGVVQREALRRWLIGGGRLWIMLEQVDETWISSALGESWNVSISDRVGLHDFTIEGPGEPLRVRSRAGVEMVRAFAPDEMEVIHRIDGYPASMRRSVGQGELLVTTVGPEAWIHVDPVDPADAPDTPDTAESAAAGNADDADRARPALRELQSFFNAPPLDADQRRETVKRAFEPMVHEQIGYSILGRGSVAMVLGLFVVALLASGGWLAWRGRLEVVGVTSAVVSLATAGALIGLGMTHHRSVDLTVATGQLIYTDHEQPYLHTIGTTGIYRPDAQGGDSMTVSGRYGVMWPVGIDTLGSWTRLEWLDDDRWQMRRSLPPGTVHHFAGEGTQPIDTPVSAVLRFTEAGMSGELRSGPFERWEDGLIASRWAHMPVALDGASERFRVGDRRLESRQYIAAATLTDQQHRRQSVYRALADGGIFPMEPMLLAWAGNGPADLSLDADALRQTHSLVMMPLEIEPPAPGTPVRIPAALLRKLPATHEVESAYRPGTLYDLEAFYDPRRHQWNELIRFDAAAVMRFEVPRALHHVDIHGATLRFNLRAPGWRYAVLVQRDGEIQEVAEGSNPLGEVEVRLSGAQVPEMTADGAVLAGLRVRRAEGGGGGDRWTLRRISLELEGVAGEVAP